MINPLIDDTDEEFSLSKANKKQGLKDENAGLVFGPPPPVLENSRPAPFTVYWAPRWDQWKEINGTWVPFFRWALDLDLNYIGFTGMVNRILALGKDYEESLVNAVRDYQDELGKISRDYKEDVGVLERRYDKPDEHSKLQVALLYAEAKRDENQMDAYHGFSDKMMTLQRRLISTEAERLGRSFALTLPLAEHDPKRWF